MATTDSSTSARQSVGHLIMAMNLTRSRKNKRPLPREVLDIIYRYADPAALAALEAARAARRQQELLLDGPHPALTPPKNGARLLTEGIPLELRKMIFAECFPDRGGIVKPVCDEEDEEAKKKKHRPRGPHAKARAKNASLIMLICKQIKNEFSVVMYEERVFEVHVHEGLRNGGIEFLDAGRQPLHYKLDGFDKRFERFRDGQEFGFEDVKKIKVVIIPDHTERLAHVVSYHMMAGLVKLLRNKSDEENPLTSFTVEFAIPAKTAPESSGRRDIMLAENPWWDSFTVQPRASSIHFVPDFELVLRPLRLLRVHNVRIDLPKKVCGDESARRFVQHLKATMQSKTKPDLEDSPELEMHLDSLREQIEHRMYDAKDEKGGAFKLEDLTEHDLIEETPRETDREQERRPGSPMRLRMSVAEKQDTRIAEGNDMGDDMGDGEEPDGDLDMLSRREGVYSLHKMRIQPLTARPSSTTSSSSDYGGFHSSPAAPRTSSAPTLGPASWNFFARIESTRTAAPPSWRPDSAPTNHEAAPTGPGDELDRQQDTSHMAGSLLPHGSSSETPYTDGATFGTHLELRSRDIETAVDGVGGYHAELHKIERDMSYPTPGYHIGGAQLSTTGASHLCSNCHQPLPAFQSHQCSPSFGVFPATSSSDVRAIARESSELGFGQLSLAGSIAPGMHQNTSFELNQTYEEDGSEYFSDKEAF